MDAVPAIYGERFLGSDGVLMGHTARDQSSTLDALHALLLTGPEVETFLGEVAELAAGLVDPVASVRVTVRYGGEFLTVASSDDRAALVDEEQYLEGLGPCLEALTTAARALAKLSRAGVGPLCLQTVLVRPVDRAREVSMTEGAATASSYRSASSDL